jgi:hypothetical protein
LQCSTTVQQQLMMLLLLDGSLAVAMKWDIAPVHVILRAQADISILSTVDAAAAAALQAWSS